MNLIEKLGGYEKAKKTLQGVGHEHDAALLEYRRANNIYEVGDKVLHPMFSSVFTIDVIQSYSVLATSMTGYHTSLAISLITHATDAEIKVGHRIDHSSTIANLTDSVTDIRNHISPNTVVIER